MAEIETISQIKSMIRNNIARLQTATGVNLSNEHLAVKLTKADITSLANAGAQDLVAFFGVDEVTNTTTVILMGLDNSGNLIKTNGNYLGIERWPSYSLSVQTIVNNPDDLNTIVFP
ncbi:MAG: hypothetical protein JST21_03755 [Bacteroidetes bacterium]|nr:hypothetical protein [Bacteroidota bacterium]